MASLTVGLLGPLHVTDREVPITSFESDKTRALLAYLAVEADRPHRREALIGLLWPDQPEEIARRNLRQTLYSLRQAIGDAGANPPYLLISREQIQFNRASDYALDVCTFETLLDTCEKGHRHCTEPCALRTAHGEQAMQLYRSDFMDQFFVADSVPYEEWMHQQREVLHRRALETLDYLAGYYVSRANYEDARRCAQQALALDPWREEAHRQLMRILALAGQRSEALVQFETCRRVLGDELGVEPAAETTLLYEQIKHEQLRAQPEPQSAPSVWTPRPLPAQPTSFIGRESELAALAQLIANPECRLITLVGPGGIGKTRLALRAAAENGASFTHGAAFVPLASATSAESIVPAIAAALAFSFLGSGNARAQLLNYLRDKQLLLVVDNIEQLLESTALWDAILAHAPQVKLLVTSRETLNVQGEWVFEVAGLQVPVGEQTDGLETYSAAALFLERARRHRVGFAPRTEERAAVTRLCRLVDGSPLALELAATWVRTLSCAEIVREIERNLDFLTVTVRDLPERHRSLRAVFDHSWRLLSDEEREVLCRLAIFRGGFSREAAQAVAGAGLRVLSTLLSKSLIRRTPNVRYDMHELVRQYVAERFSERGCAEARRRHFEFFFRLALEAEPKLVGSEQVTWLNQLEHEHDNLRSALDWSLNRIEKNNDLPLADSQHAAEALLRFASALHPFWKRRDHWAEGRAWLERTLASTADWPGGLTRAKALNCAALLALEQADIAAAAEHLKENRALAVALADPYRLAAVANAQGYLLWKQKDFSAARTECQRAVALFRSLDKPCETADALHFLAHITTNQGDFDVAQAYLNESASLYAQLGERLGYAFSINDLGLVAYLQNEPATARSRFEKALSAFREFGSRPGVVSALNGLGDLARYDGDYSAAGRCYREALELYRPMGDRDEIPSLLHNLGYVELHGGHPAQALALFREALSMQQENHNDAGIAECLAGIAAVFAAQETLQAAAQLLAAAELLRQSTGGALWPANRIEHELTLGRLRARLDPAALAEAWAQGRSMTIRQTLRLAYESDR